MDELVSIDRSVSLIATYKRPGYRGRFSDHLTSIYFTLALDQQLRTVRFVGPEANMPEAIISDIFSMWCCSISFI